MTQGIAISYFNMSLGYLPALGVCGTGPGFFTLLSSCSHLLIIADPWCLLTYWLLYLWASLQNKLRFLKFSYSYWISKKQISLNSQPLYKLSISICILHILIAWGFFPFLLYSWPRRERFHFNSIQKDLVSSFQFHKDLQVFCFLYFFFS